MPGPELKLNTADFELMLGGRYLLEGATNTLDGYLLEDGSGVLLLDAYVPQLGDPVTFTNPSWAGRVVSVQSEDIFDKRTNYNRVTVEATNSATAPGGSAPGDLSDVPAGGYFTLEDSSGRYQLEDGTGLYEQEGTSYGYRHLSVRTSQNQDGTTTTYGSLETFEFGFAAGQTFALTSVNLGVSGTSYTITNVTTTFVGAGPATPLYTIEFGDAYQTLQLAGGGVLTRQGSQANIQAGVAMPGGVLGYASVTANQGSITAQVDLTGLTVTVTVGSGRRLEITGFAFPSSTIADDQAVLYIMEGATQLALSAIHMRVVGQGDTLTASAILTPTAGVHTYKLQMARTGTGTVTMNASSTDPAYILVEDIGT